MQALKLQAVFGVRWIVGGWRMLRKQPFSFMALLFLFWLVVLCASAIISSIAQGLGRLLPFLSVDLLAAIGGLLFAALTPSLTVGFLGACRVADTGLDIHPLQLFAPLRAGRRTVVRLFCLGLIQMALLIAILMALNGTAVHHAEPRPQQTTATDANGASKTTARDAVDEADLRRQTSEALTQGIAFLPVALVMWYAPMLVAWHGLPVGKAIFFSAVGVWRNRAAFVVYGAGWLVILMGTSIVATLIAMIVGMSNLVVIVVAPLVMLMITAMYCSIYQSYATVYVEAPPVET